MPVPSFFACIQTSVASGHCINSTTTDEFDIDPINLYQNKNWSQWQYDMIYLPPDSYAAIKDFILLECEKQKNCPKQIKEIKKKMTYFESQLKSMPQ